MSFLSFFENYIKLHVFFVKIFLVILTHLIKDIGYYEKEVQLFHISRLKLEFRETKNIVSKEPQDLDSILKLFAIINELVKRHYFIKIHNTQYLGALTLNFNYLPEIKTGEGKTLVTLLISVLKAITQKEVHIITSNSYLVERDYYFLKPIYEHLDLTFDFFKENTHNISPKKIIIGTPSNFVFNYLNSFLSVRHKELSHSCLIIDELDDVLLNISKTPFIISSKKNNHYTSELDSYLKIFYDFFNKNIELFHIKNHESDDLISLNHDIINKIDYILNPTDRIFVTKFDNLLNNYWIHFLQNFNIAVNKLQRDKDYFVKNNKIVLINKDTARSMSDHTFSRGIQKAIEIKEALPLSSETIPTISLDFPNFVKNYQEVLGFSGTLLHDKRLLHELYGLEILPIVSKFKKRLIVHTSILTYKKHTDNFLKLIQCYKLRKQPLLINFENIEHLEKIDFLLKTYKKNYQRLDAIYESDEKKIIHSSGSLNALTLSTNILTRGTDIKLGSQKIRDISILKHGLYVKALGGLSLLGSDIQMSMRNEEQVIGRTSRQGNPGEFRFNISYNNKHVAIQNNNAWEDSIFRFLNIPINYQNSLINPLTLLLKSTYQRNIEKKESELYKAITKDNKINYSFILHMTYFKELLIGLHKKKQGILSVVNTGLLMLLENIYYSNTYISKNLSLDYLFLTQIHYNTTKLKKNNQQLSDVFYILLLFIVYFKSLQDKKINVQFIKSTIHITYKTLLLGSLNFIEQTKNMLRIPEFSFMKSMINSNHSFNMKMSVFYKNITRDNFFLIMLILL